MTVELETEALTGEVEDMSKDVSGEAARRWHSASEQILLAEGDELEYEVFPIAEAFIPPQWTGEQWEFHNNHPAARFLEDGTDEHVVEPNEADVLAFEWPDAPQDVREMFEDTFPTVFFPKAEVAGIPALHFLLRGRQEAERWLRRQ